MAVSKEESNVAINYYIMRRLYDISLGNLNGFYEIVGCSKGTYDKLVDVGNDYYWTMKNASHKHIVYLAKYGIPVAVLSGERCFELGEDFPSSFWKGYIKCREEIVSNKDEDLKARIKCMKDKIDNKLRAMNKAGKFTDTALYNWWYYLKNGMVNSQLGKLDTSWIDTWLKYPKDRFQYASIEELTEIEDKLTQLQERIHSIVVSKRW